MPDIAKLEEYFTEKVDTLEAQIDALTLQHGTLENKIDDGVATEQEKAEYEAVRVARDAATDAMQALIAAVTSDLNNISVRNKFENQLEAIITSLGSAKSRLDAQTATAQRIGRAVSTTTKIITKLIGFS